MAPQLTPGTSVEHLRKEAKRWLKTLRAGDANARERLSRAWPEAPAAPGLRDVQYALAREYGTDGWKALKDAAADLQHGGSARDRLVRELLRAAERGDAIRVGEILDADPDIVNDRGTLEGHTGLRTALHFGVESEPVVRTLLERGADPNIRDEGDNAYPLHFAAERGDLPVIRLLVERGAQTVAGEVDDHALDIIGWGTCFPGVEIRPAVVEYLLAHGARHTLHSAVAVGDGEAIRARARDDPDAIERPMDTVNRRRHALHLAVVKKQPESVKTLLELGADPNAEDAGGLTPLDEAALSGARDMAQMLIESGAELRLAAAVALERVHDVDRLLRDDPDALKPGGRWGTLIVKAAASAPGRAVETLIRFGADVNVVEDEAASVDGTRGYTPLHAAAFHGNLEAVDVLLKHGANPFARDSRYGGTPAGWARHAGRQEVAERLGSVETQRELTHGGHLAVTHEERVDAFMRMACLDWRVGGSERRQQTSAAVRLLTRHPELARDAALVCGRLDDVRCLFDEDPQVVNRPVGPRQWPPLLYVCSARLPGYAPWVDNAVEIARLLLERGADPNAYYRGGDASIHYTALTCVIGRGEEQAATHPRARELAALLLDRGAEPYDIQVFYNAFAGHASFPFLAEDDLVWLLELIYRASVKRGRQADWQDPAWRMIDMGGYGSGASYLLERAKEGGHRSIIQWALSHGADPTFAAEAPPERAPDAPAQLFKAAAHDLIDEARRLLDEGLSPDSQNTGGARPLHVAAYAGAARAATLLIERGAEIDPRDRVHGTTPIYWAYFAQRWAMVDLLAPFSRDVWALVPTAKLDRLREVLAAEPRLGRVAWEGGTPLFNLPDDEIAAAEIVRLFLSRGADPAFRRSDGATAGQLARARGLDEAAALLEAG